jgi:hypothetical protein
MNAYLLLVGVGSTERAKFCLSSGGGGAAERNWKMEDSAMMVWLVATQIRAWRRVISHHRYHTVHDNT